MSVHVSWQSVLSYAKTHTLVTPNARLASVLQDVYGQQQKTKCWPTPRILSWGGWIEQLWQQACFTPSLQPPYVLDALCAQGVWEQVIGKFQPDIIRLSGLATLAHQAHEQLVLWQAEATLEEVPLTQDQHAFRMWLSAFSKHCKDRHWVTEAQRLVWLSQQGPKQFLEREKEQFILVNFDTLNPLQAHLITCWKEHGVSFEHASSKPFKAPVYSRLSCETDTQELLRAACWAHQTVKNNPALHIAVVVPNLTQRRQEVVEVFQDVFMPSAHLPGSEYSLQQFNISGGRAFTSNALISVAVMLLKLLQTRKGELSVWQTLLLSPYWGGDTASQRRTLLGQLEEKAPMQCRVKEVISCFIKTGNTQGEEGERLLSYFDVLQKAGKKGKHSLLHWSMYWSEALRQLGWPGERVLTSEEFQSAHVMWQATLDSLVRLSPVVGDLSAEQSMTWLHRVLQSKVTQTRSDITSVHVLGLLEAVGQTFDAVWLIGMDDGTWPAAVNLHPLIPACIQKKYDMPHATAQRELAVGKQLFQRFKESTAHLIVSFARFQGDVQRQVSPLAEELPEVSWSSFAVEDALIYRHTVFKQRPALDACEDQYGSCLPLGSTVQGGVSVIQDQLACPFKAFARHRLNACALPESKEGLSLQDQGILVHSLLEDLWQAMRHQEHLLALTAEELTAKIVSAVDQRVLHYQQHRPDVDKLLLDIERKRLVSLLEEWFSLEKERPPFHVVIAERSRRCMLGGIELQLRIDRVDYVNEGHVIWDYKTSETAQVQHWFQSRLPEPQLPLYAVTFDAAVIGMGYAKVIPTRARFEALWAEETVDWQEKMNQWSIQVTQAAEQFRMGNAQLDPTPWACQYCELTSLCRIKERLCNPAT